MESALALIAALGGAENILDIEPCSLRIRVEVASQHEVDEEALRIPGVLAVVRSGAVVQIVAGPVSDSIAEEMRQILAAR